MSARAPSRELIELWSLTIKTVNELDSVLPVAIYVYPWNRGKVAKAVMPGITSDVRRAEEILSRFEREALDLVRRWERRTGVTGLDERIRELVEKVRSVVDELPNASIDEVGRLSREAIDELFKGMHEIWMEMRRAEERALAPAPLKVVSAYLYPPETAKPIVFLKIRFSGNEPSKVYVEAFDKGVRTAALLVDVSKEKVVSMAIPLLRYYGKHEIVVRVRSPGGKVLFEKAFPVVLERARAATVPAVVQAMKSAIKPAHGKRKGRGGELFVFVL